MRSEKPRLQEKLPLTEVLKCLYNTSMFFDLFDECLAGVKFVI